MTIIMKPITGVFLNYVVVKNFCNFFVLLDFIIAKLKTPRVPAEFTTYLPYAWFSFATLLFTAGLVGIFFNNKNFLLFIFKLELMFIGLNLFLIGGAHYSLTSYSGYAYAILIFGIVAADSVIGLSLFLTFFLLKQTIVFHIYELSRAEGYPRKKRRNV